MIIKQRIADFLSKVSIDIESTGIRRIILPFVAIVVFVCIVCFSIYEALAFFVTSIKGYMLEFWANIVREWSK